MLKSILSFAAAAALCLSSSVVAAPYSPYASTTHLEVVETWLDNNSPGVWAPCTDSIIAVRKDFDAMLPQERKAFTDAINCIRSQPSKLDPNVYPGAINKYYDYSTIHVNRSRDAHLNGFFLTWHRMYLHIFEQDIRTTCGYQGAFPYWNWPATADNLRASPIFNGDQYSMSGDGYFTNDNPIQIAPSFSLPHGSGGGCIMSGPFAGMTKTINDIPLDFLINGTDLPHSVYAKNESCITRDLNTFVAQKWANYTAVQEAVEAPDLTTLDLLLNGVIGGTELGIHSAAHFTMGSPASNIFVSAQDPIWYPLHAMLDRVYTSWQIRHPDQANAVYGTATPQDLPASANVTVDSIVPDWGYLDQYPYKLGDLQSTTAGPFCYKYDINI